MSLPITARQLTALRALQHTKSAPRADYSAEQLQTHRSGPTWQPGGVDSAPGELSQLELSVRSAAN
jgi:hypothetical protein